MPNNYILALKEYNKDKPKWCVPKKDSPDYKKVMFYKQTFDNADLEKKEMGEAKQKAEQNIKDFYKLTEAQQKEEVFKEYSNIRSVKTQEEMAKQREKEKREAQDKLFQKVFKTSKRPSKKEREMIEEAQKVAEKSVELYKQIKQKQLTEESKVRVGNRLTPKDFVKPKPHRELLADGYFTDEVYLATEQGTFKTDNGVKTIYNIFELYEPNKKIGTFTLFGNNDKNPNADENIIKEGEDNLKKIGMRNIRALAIKKTGMDMDAQYTSSNPPDWIYENEYRYVRDKRTDEVVYISGITNDENDPQVAFNYETTKPIGIWDEKNKMSIPALITYDYNNKKLYYKIK